MKSGSSLGMDSRERLLEVAGRLLYERGIAATGVDTLSAEAGVAKTSLYHHFESKDGLVAAYLLRHDDRWRRDLHERLEGADEDPVAHLQALVSAYYERATAPGFRGCPFFNAAAEISDSDHPARGVVAQHKEEVREMIRRNMSEAGVSDPEFLSAHLFTLLEGLLAVAALDPHHADLDAARRKAQEIVDQTVAS